MPRKITVGCTTSHGGMFMGRSQRLMSVMGKAVIVDNDFIWCPKCKKVTYARANNTLSFIEGKAIVLEGDSTTCGAFIFCTTHNLAQSERVGGHGATGGDSDSDEEHKGSFVGKGQALHPETGEPMPDCEYYVSIAGGPEERFITDHEGFTHLIQADNPADVQLRFSYDHPHDDDISN